jgi:hypothetical protein
MKGWWAWVFGGALLFPSLAAAHGTSKSFGAWTVRGDRAELSLSFAAHDVTAAVAGLDADRDQRLSGAELRAGTSTLSARIEAGTRLDGCRLDRPTQVTGRGEPVDELHFQLAFKCAGPLSHFRLQVEYLPELEPPHVSVAVVKAGAQEVSHIFGPAAPVFDATLAAPTFAEEVQVGLQNGLQVGLRPAGLLLGLGLGLLGGGVWAWGLLLLGGLVAGVWGLAAPVWALPLLVGAAGAFWERSAPWARWVGRVVVLGAGLSLGAGQGWSGLAATLGQLLVWALTFGLGLGLSRRLGERGAGPARWALGIAGVGIALRLAWP